MTRRPPISTLFPSPPLSRSRTSRCARSLHREPLARRARRAGRASPRSRPRDHGPAAPPRRTPLRARSRAPRWSGGADGRRAGGGVLAPAPRRCRPADRSQRAFHRGPQLLLHARERSDGAGDQVLAAEYGGGDAPHIGRGDAVDAREPLVEGLGGRGEELSRAKPPDHLGGGIAGELTAESGTFFFPHESVPRDPPLSRR